MQTKVSEPQPSLGLLRDPSCELPPGKRAKKAVHLQREDRVQKEMVMSGPKPFLGLLRGRRLSREQPPGKRAVNAADRARSPLGRPPIVGLLYCLQFLVRRRSAVAELGRLGFGLRLELGQQRV